MKLIIFYHHFVADHLWQICLNCDVCSSAEYPLTGAAM
jgi:hypothetical protein